MSTGVVAYVGIIRALNAINRIISGELSASQAFCDSGSTADTGIV